MKKLLFLCLTFFLSIFVLACELTSTSGRTTSDVSTTSNETSTTTSLTTSSSSTTTTSNSTTTTTTTTTSNSTTTTATTTSTTATTNNATPLIPSGYSLLQDELDVVGIPSLGEQKILVFAVDFSDYPASSADVTIADLNLAFNGADTDVAYESLHSYYFKSSFGHLDLTADIYGYYRASHPASYYEDEYEKLYATDAWGDPLYSDEEVTYPDSDLIYELLLYYDSTIDYTEYDGNNDGYIDGIYVVNTAPVSYDYYGSDLWWAYQDVYIYEGDIFDSNAEPYYFVWLGTDFFLEGNEGINARTIIHETGHMLGLEDYYDYDQDSTYNDGGLGGADMMDDAVGDHNPFSKILLGWITPLVVTSSMVVDLTPFIINGEVILIIDQWNNTIFDEYLLISLYTPAGLNQMDQASIFTVSGMVVYHVNGSIANGTPVNTVYPSIFDSNNSDTRYKLIQIIEADGDGDIDQYWDAENSDLFQQSRTLSWQVSQTFSWDRGGLPDRLTILFSVVNNSSATLTITIPQ